MKCPECKSKKIKSVIKPIRRTVSGYWDNFNRIYCLECEWEGNIEEVKNEK